MYLMQKYTRTKLFYELHKFFIVKKIFLITSFIATNIIDTAKHCKSLNYKEKNKKNIVLQRYTYTV